MGHVGWCVFAQLTFLTCGQRRVAALPCPLWRLLLLPQHDSFDILHHLPIPGPCCWDNWLRFLSSNQISNALIQNDDWHDPIQCMQHVANITQTQCPNTTSNPFPMSNWCLVQGLKNFYGCVVLTYSCGTWNKQHWHDRPAYKPKNESPTFGRLRFVWAPHVFNACLFNALLSGKLAYSLTLSAKRRHQFKKRDQLIESPTLWQLPAVVFGGHGRHVQCLGCCGRGI